MLSLLLSLKAVASGSLWPDLSNPQHVGGGAEDAAVVVAIEDYVFVSDIEGAKLNGLDWYSYLTDGRGIAPSRVHLLEDQRATRESIEKAVRTARDQVRPGGTLWFVFVGHGAPGMDGTDGVLLGVDTQQNADSVYARGLLQSELLELLGDGRQQETVMFLDACFSGQSNTGALVANLMPLIPTYAMATGDVFVLSAGTGQEFAGPLPGASRPAFSYLALGGLSGWADRNDDGDVTARELTEYTRDALKAMPLGRSQTPQFYGPDKTIILASGRSDGPSLSSIRRELSEARGEEAAPRNNLSAQLRELRGQQEEAERLRAEQARSLQTTSDEVAARRDRVLSEASAQWLDVMKIAVGSLDARAVEAFLLEYESKEIFVGGQRYPVSVPEVLEAKAWLLRLRIAEGRTFDPKMQHCIAFLERSYVYNNKKQSGLPQSVLAIENIRFQSIGFDEIKIDIMMYDHIGLHYIDEGYLYHVNRRGPDKSGSRVATVRIYPNQELKFRHAVIQFHYEGTHLTEVLFKRLHSNFRIGSTDRYSVAFSRTPDGNCYPVSVTKDGETIQLDEHAR